MVLEHSLNDVSCVMILEGMVVLGIPPLELMQCLRPLSELVHSGVQELVILDLVPMSM